MFSGPGLGYLNLTAGGISTGSLTCVTPEEMAEAKSKCRVGSLRGLGGPTYQVLAPMGGRLAPVSPCDILKMPTCPTPTCLDDYSAGVVAQCIAGQSPSPDVDCGSLVVAGLSRLPYCGGHSSALGPLPSCLSPDQQTLRTYCQTTPGGPNKTWNSLCWLMQHDPSYWQSVLATPECKHAPHVLEVPHRAPPPAAPPSAPPELVDPHPGDSGSGSSGTMGVIGILALVAAAGGGYYLYRRYKR